MKITAERTCIKKLEFNSDFRLENQGCLTQWVKLKKIETRGAELSQAQPCWGEGLIEIGLNWAKSGMINIRVKYWNVIEVVSFR